jgi:flavorubredoxin
MPNATTANLLDGIDWVGYVDWNVRDFHGYTARRGTTYNAYLVRDEKTVLVDAVKAPYADSLLENVASLTDPAQVDYVVCNHAEPDHAGTMDRVLEALPGATLLANAKGLAALGQHFDTSGWKTRAVDNGETISLGRRSLRFVNTPMVHWPESMFTYVPEEKLLFSMDAFGQHYATSQRFDDEADLPTVMREAKAYYANIVMPFGKQVVKTLGLAAELEIDCIAPSHGLIWRRHLGEILRAYGEWAQCRARPKVLVVYDTMWGSTGRMAESICAGATDEGVEAVLAHVRRTDLTRLATEVLDAAAVAFGSSTLNREMMPMASAVLTYWKGLGPVGKAGFAFGSYGWSKGGPEAVDEGLRSLKWEVLREPLRAQYRPSPEVLDECREAGRMLARKAREIAGEGATSAGTAAGTGAGRQTS